MDNKYTRWYFSIISSAKIRNLRDSIYVEKHHIVPDCFYTNRSRKGPPGELPGNPNDPDNIVLLTAREHFICHLLLIRMVDGKRKKQMWFSAWSLGNRKMHTNSVNMHHSNSRTYEKLKREFSNQMSELHGNKKVSSETRLKISLARTGKKLSEDHKTKIREGLIGRKHSDETKDKISKSNLGKHSSKGRKHSEETKQKIAKSHKGKIKGPLSEVTRKKISDATKGRSQSDDHVIQRVASRQNGSYYVNREETIAKMRKSAANRSLVECEKCKKLITRPMHARWHGNNCKVSQPK